jgi:hypothetical protein
MRVVQKGVGYSTTNIYFSGFSRSRYRSDKDIRKLTSLALIYKTKLFKTLNLPV